MSKLIQSLKSLDRKTLQSFSTYLHSPYFCQHTDTISLFDFLSPHHPHFELDLFAEFQKLFPEGKLKRSRFNVLSSYLLQQLHGFLVQEQLRKQPVLQQILLVDSLRKREHYKEAQKQLDGARKQLAEASPLDSGNLIDQLRLQELQLDLNFSVEMRSNPAPLEDFFETLDEHYMGMGMKYLLPTWTFKRMFDQDFPQDRWQTCQSMLEAHRMPPSPLVRMYFHLLHLLQGNEETQQLEALDQLLEEHGSRMSKEEHMNVYGYLQNHFTKQLLQGEPEALRNLFAVYQKLDHYGLVFGRGDFSAHLIRNITVTGCRLGELEWTRHFIQANREEIQKQLGGAAYAYSQAYLDFYSGAYSKALHMLQKLDFVDPFYRTGHQILLLRIYYELGDFESLDVLSATFRRYLNRSPLLSEARKGPYRTFISILKQLGKAKENAVTAQRLAKIRGMLDESKEVIDRTWLTAKWEELGRKSPQ